jgi:hypothetical protein
LAVIKAQQEALIQQTNAALKTFNSLPKVSSPQKDKNTEDAIEDPDIVEKYETYGKRVIQGSDLKVEAQSLPVKPTVQQHSNTSALCVLFKKKANRYIFLTSSIICLLFSSSSFLDLEVLLFPKQASCSDVMNVETLKAKILPFNEKQIENLAYLLPSTSTHKLNEYPDPPEMLQEASDGNLQAEECDNTAGLQDAPAELAPPAIDIPKQRLQKNKDSFDFRTLLEMPVGQELKPPKFKKKDRKFILEFQKHEKPKNVVEQWLEQKETFSFSRFLSIKDFNSGFFSQFNGSIEQFKLASIKVIPCSHLFW